MNLSKQTITPFVFILFAPFLAMAQSVGVCGVDQLSVGAVEVDWRTFAPKDRFERPHYLVPGVHE